MRPSMVSFRCVSVVLAWMLLQLSVQAESGYVYAPLSPKNTRVAQNLLKLIHTPEVQKDLGIESQRAEELERVLRELDQVWWPARIMPPEKQRELVAQLEAKLSDYIQARIGKSTLERLQQLELQSQAIRVLARPDVVRYLGLDSNQTGKLDGIFADVDRLEAGLDPTNVDLAKQKAFQDAKKDEIAKALAVLTQSQSQKLQTLFGKHIDTAKLERIYPLAPNLIATGHQYGEAKLDLRALRGKVVLVHFYAFQCHNCHANFAHYKRWSKELKDQGVEVIGIQTPETPDERDPKKVIAAAQKEAFPFPVLIDVESQNWKAWGNTMWPTIYVIDKQGYIRLWWQGELNWQGATGDKKIEALVKSLLAES